MPRIIGGDWRGHRFDVPDRPGLRPTPDRVRETLFNWLQWDLPGARCLDLFGGSGALGLEAASRGAAEVLIVESDASACAAICSNITALNAAHRVELIRQDAFDFIASAPEPFDLVLLDPPFHTGQLDQAIAGIHSTRLCRDGGQLYFEHAADEAAPRLPPDLSPHRNKRAGRVAYGLCHCRSAV